MQIHNKRFSLSKFDTLPHLSHGYFSRKLGSVTKNGFPDNSTLKNVSESLSIPIDSFKLMNQVHGESVTLVSSHTQQVSSDYDGLVTTESGVFLGIKTADCLPVLLYDEQHHVIGACHAGYKGLLNGIIQNTITKMENVGADRDAIIVGIGPSICKSCYTVNRDRIELFQNAYPEMKNFYVRKDETCYLDLKQIALFILESVGIAVRNIEFSPFCTREHTDLFFSRRYEKTGVFLSGIGMI
jgi:YfiH family protein